MPTDQTIKELTVATGYDKDIVAWSNEQAALLRAGRLSELDIEHLAEEIEDVGKSEQREFSSRMAKLIGHLLKHEFQPEMRSRSWCLTIREQRAAIERCVKRTPSLRTCLTNPDWIADAWIAGVEDAVKETGLEREAFPEHCHYDIGEVMQPDYFPGQTEPQICRPKAS